MLSDDFPQYPSSQAVPQFSSQPSADSLLLPRQPQVISVLSGTGAGPHQAVSWNPPPTIVPPSLNSRQKQTLQINPQPQSSPLSSSVFSPPEDKEERQSRFVPQSVPSPQNSFQSNPVREAEPSRVIPSRQSQPASPNAPPVAVPANPAATGADGKPQKDDVVIYYYYYYDDDKNTTNKSSGDTSLDSIPSLESFDQNKPNRGPSDKPGRVVIKNLNENNNEKFKFCQQRKGSCIWKTRRKTRRL